MTDERTDEPKLPLSETRALVDQVKRGDRERFAELFGRVAPALYSWASLRTPRRAQAVIAPEDVVQEVWCRALMRFGDFDPERARFRSWIFGIAKNVMMKAFDALGRQPIGQQDASGTASLLPLNNVPDDATAVSQRVARDLTLKAFLKRIEALDEGDRELLVLRGIEGLPHEDIAVHLGIAKDAAQKRWVRLRDRLRSEGVPDDVIAA